MVEMMLTVPSRPEGRSEVAVLKFLLGQDLAGAPIVAAALFLLVKEF